MTKETIGSKNSRMKYRYSINLADYDELLTRQSGRCAICGCVPDGQILQVDHDHSCCPGYRSCGKCIRGLLCKTCNSGLGLLKDDIKILQSAIDYLEGVE